MARSPSEPGMQNHHMFAREQRSTRCQNSRWLRHTIPFYGPSLAHGFDGFDGFEGFEGFSAFACFASSSFFPFFLQNLFFLWLACFYFFSQTKLTCFFFAVLERRRVYKIAFI